MQRSNLRFVFLILLLSIFQVVINNSTKVYLDCLSVVLVIILFANVFSFRSVIILALFADLIGHWYLGSHLFAAMIVSFMARPLVNFYKMSGGVQRSITIAIFYTILTCIITLIGMITHNLSISWLDFAIEIFILCPAILFLYNFTKIKTYSPDIIY